MVTDTGFPDAETGTPRPQGLRCSATLPTRDSTGMETVHGDVLALLRRWRDAIDADELAVPIDLAALQARRAAHAPAWIPDELYPYPAAG